MSDSSSRRPVVRLVAAFSLLSTSLLSAGAAMGHASRAPVEITVGGCWSDPLQGGAFIRIAEGFNKVQSAIHVKAIRGVNQTKVLAGVSAGNPIDVYYDCTTSDLPQWASSGYAQNLDPFIKQENFNLKSIIPS